MHWGKMPIDGSNSLIDEARLSMEARSIFKSIRTEQSKLVQSQNLSRSDLHYFRARFNYYRLSLLRLEAEEKHTLEPALSQFLEHIVAREGEDEPSAPPFLETVASPEPTPQTTPEFEIKKAKTPPTTSSFESEPKRPSSSLEAPVKDELRLIQMALASEPSRDLNQLLSRKLARLIDSL